MIRREYRQFVHYSAAKTVVVPNCYDTILMHRMCANIPVTYTRDMEFITGAIIDLNIP